ncbi:hypothetical protein Rhow_001079 [Rhodococcus wratislaviensis]|uniref:Uncharacterized protein n=1 Tax=Rhodococcus wratislaviensis TaxID=44752 RepID=A0A402CN64_RHOWR|nr:hypothetical protein Rhow_001079 [Rhodococcus wratislaviensis]
MTPESSETFTTVAASCSHILGPIAGVPLPARRPRTAGIRTRTDPPGLHQARPKQHDLRFIATGRAPIDGSPPRGHPSPHNDRLQRAQRDARCITCTPDRGCDQTGWRSLCNVWHGQCPNQRYTSGVMQERSKSLKHQLRSLIDNPVTDAVDRLEPKTICVLGIPAQQRRSDHRVPHSVQEPHRNINGGIREFTGTDQFSRQEYAIPARAGHAAPPPRCLPTRRVGHTSATNRAYTPSRNADSSTVTPVE